MLDIGGGVGVEIKRAERKGAPQPSSPATELERALGLLHTEHIATGAAKQNATLSSHSPESPFDLPIRLKPNHQLRTSQTLELLYVPANSRSLLHQTSLEMWIVTARAKGNLTLQSTGLQP